LIRPWINHLYEAVYNNWTARQRTLYLYDEETYPGEGDLTKGQLWLVRQQASEDLDPNPNYREFDTIDTAYSYNADGSVNAVTTYAGYGGVKVVVADDDWGQAVYAPGRGSAVRPLTTTYDSTGLLIESITNPAGDETGYGYGETIHNNTPPHPFLLTSITPANGLSSEFEY